MGWGELPKQDRKDLIRQLREAIAPPMTSNDREKVDRLLAELERA